MKANGEESCTATRADDDAQALVNLDDENDDHAAGLPHFASAAHPQGHEDHQFTTRTSPPPVSLPSAAFKPPEPRPLTGGLQAYVQQAALQLEESPLHSSKGPPALDADATAALQAALGGHMDVDPREKKTPPSSSPTSPDKRPRRQQQARGSGLQSKPMFGGPQPPNIGPSPAPPYPLNTGSTPTPTTTPQHHHIGDEPSWLSGFRDTLLADMKGMRQDQRQILNTVQEQREEFRVVGQRLDRVEDRNDQLSKAQLDLSRKLDALTTELQEVRSRSVSPAPTPRRGDNSGRAGTGQAPSTGVGSTAPGGPVIDDWQLVLGGYVDAKREEIQQEIRELFQAAEAVPLLRNIITPYVRSNIARIELLYVDDNLAARRRVQQAVLNKLRQILQERDKKSNLPGQTGQLWISRNRSIEERNRNRAILGLRDYGRRFLPENEVDFDWKGRVWYRGAQVLFHADRDSPVPQALMMLDARGNESGWWTNPEIISRVLGMDPQQVRDELSS